LKKFENFENCEIINCKIPLQKILEAHKDLWLCWKLPLNVRRKNNFENSP
jgi:hypothetical protein